MLKLKKKLLYIIFIAFIFSIKTVLFANEKNLSLDDKILKEKIAQMIILGFRGMEIKKNDTIYKLIKNEKIGGVIFFDYDVPNQEFKRNIENPKQLKKLSSKLQKISKHNLFITIDQEGGKVCRLRENYGFPETVSQQYLGEKNDPLLTSKYAEKTAITLKNTGININFAPCVDLNINPECPIIGKKERSFSDDPEIVTNHSKIIINKYKEIGILSALKHFPGHGSTTADTHYGIADASKTYNNKELIPFKNLINEGIVDIVMTSHVFNANFDSEYPATMSYNTLTNKLRKELKFNGIIISDDMAMGAIAKQYDLATCLEKAINAGVDIFIFSNNGEIYDKNIGYKAIDTIFNLVKEKKISQERISESFNRIKILKNKVGLKNLKI
jgi:beta-N-acetylhexosaminidase